MVDHYIADEAIQFTAAETEFTADEIDRFLQSLQSDLGENLVDLYKTAWKKNIFHHLTEFDDGVCFGIGATELSHSYTDPEWDEATAAMAAHHYQARNLFGFAVKTKVSNVEDHLPVFVQHPKNGQHAQGAVGLWFYRFFYLGLTPAEAVDYWLCEVRNWSPTKVAGQRDVGAEAVRKNIRGAREKLFDPDDSNEFHKPARITTVSVRDADIDLFEEPPKNYRSVGDTPEQDSE